MHSSVMMAALIPVHYPEWVPLVMTWVALTVNSEAYQEVAMVLYSVVIRELGYLSGLVG